MSRPVVVQTIPEIRAVVGTARVCGKRVGLVPTMGALHAGHASLIQTARRECEHVVVSIFVNPTQFGPNEDFARYPRTLDADIELCGQAGAHAVFAPKVETIYPPDFVTQVEVRDLQDRLCGASRPGHFRSVCTVVLKLFNIVQPDLAYFGQKDAQQALILTRMARELNLPVELHTLPTVREPDGLALSSRNRYLDAEQRRNASGIWRALTAARQLVESGARDPAAVEVGLMRDLAAIPGCRIDYAQVVSAETLAPLPRLQGQVLIAVAVYFGSTRLIDNVQFSVTAKDHSSDNSSNMR